MPRTDEGYGRHGMKVTNGPTTLRKITKSNRDRTYQVLMAALAEEATILTKEEVSKRSQEIWQSCYGD